MPSHESIIGIIGDVLNERLGPVPEYGKIRLETDKAFRKIEATFPFMLDKGALDAMERALRESVGEETGRKPRIKFYFEIGQHRVKLGSTVIPGIANIIAVGSGKGGVGKSATTANLAVSLANMGARVGILDADIYGPSMPTIFGKADKQIKSLRGKFQPVVSCGVRMVSIGFIAGREEAVIWRGALVNKALGQLLNDTDWGELDYLLVDLPPGTGDIHLTMAQRMPITGAVIVSTPQDLALVDARRAITMFDKVGIPVVGVLENMSMHVCSNCGHAEPVFGEGGAERLAERIGAPLLGKLPLATAIRVAMDEGVPSDLADEHPAIAALYDRAAIRLTMLLSSFKKDYSHSFSGISIVKEPVKNPASSAPDASGRPSGAGARDSASSDSASDSARASSEGASGSAAGPATDPES